jgi:hypothetical protein
MKIIERLEPPHGWSRGGRSHSQRALSHSRLVETTPNGQNLKNASSFFGLVGVAKPPPYAMGGSWPPHFSHRSHPFFSPKMIFFFF